MTEVRACRRCPVYRAENGGVNEERSTDSAGPIRAEVPVTKQVPFPKVCLTMGFAGSCARKSLAYQATVPPTTACENIPFWRRYAVPEQFVVV